MAVVAAEAVAPLVMMNCHGSIRMSTMNSPRHVLEFGRLIRSRLYGHAYQGIQDGLTSYLDQDVIPSNLDFDADPQGQYLTSFGYSDEYDEFSVPCRRYQDHTRNPQLYKLMASAVRPGVELSVDRDSSTLIDRVSELS